MSRYASEAVEFKLARLARLTWGGLCGVAYLINNGIEYPIAHIVGLIEHILETAYLPAKYRVFKSQGGLVILGAAIVLAGQVVRSFAMISAASNFSHM